MMSRTTMMYKYEFEDMKVIALEDGFGTLGETNVYVEIDENLIFVFGVKTKAFRDVDINALHKNGYFDEVAFGKGKKENE